jgi:hypothetical protein
LIEPISLASGNDSINLSARMAFGTSLELFLADNAMMAHELGIALSRNDAVGQASRLSLTFNDRLEAMFSKVSGRPPKGEGKFKWRQARRLSYASRRTRPMLVLLHGYG